MSHDTKRALLNIVRAKCTPLKGDVNRRLPTAPVRTVPEAHFRVSFLHPALQQTPWIRSPPTPHIASIEFRIDESAFRIHAEKTRRQLLNGERRVAVH